MSMTKSQYQANKKWGNKNRGKVAYTNARSNTKMFILDRATREDLENIKKYVAQRSKRLTKVDKLKEKKMLELVKKFPPNEQHSYIVDLKSVLMKKQEFQGLWTQMKPIQGDPLLAIVDNQQVINLEENETVK